MSARARREWATDAAGQVIRVGDLAGGVRLGAHPVTVVGPVVALSRRQATIRVVNETGGRGGVETGSEVPVYLCRTLKVQGILPGDRDRR